MKFTRPGAAMHSTVPKASDEIIEGETDYFINPFEKFRQGNYKDIADSVQLLDCVFYFSFQIFTKVSKKSSQVSSV